MYLNDNQEKAVLHKDGPCLVLAGPGSGKTRVIAHRIVNMIQNQGIPATRILAISFTKASSIDMKKRTLELGNDERLKKVHFGTFHSIFFRILRRYANISLDNLISEVDRFKLAKNIIKHLKIKNYSDDDISDVLSEISYVKNEMMEVSDFHSQVFSEDEFQDIFRLYEKSKKQMAKIDFDDMLVLTYKLLKREQEVLDIVRNVFQYILIDEFQDINRVQFEVIRLIAMPKNNIFVVGDEDQSIYGFRGARPDFMIEFEKYFSNSKRVVLDINYRSKKNIVELSQKLIKNNKVRYEKKVLPFLKEEGNIKYINPKDYDDEAKVIAKEIKAQVEKNGSYNDYAVIYRTNRQSRSFVDVFMDERIPFVLKDTPKSLYDHWVCIDLISYLKIATNTGNNEDWARIINRPFRYISKENVKKALDSDDFFQSLMDNDNIKKFQKDNLEDLYSDLEYVRFLKPEYAISYIRSTLDYDRYILDYCHDRKIKSKQIVDIIDEFENSSKEYKTIFDFFKHIEEVREEMRKKSENKTSSLEDMTTDSVVLTTMHSSKGLEFPNVYMIGINDTVIPFITQEDEEPADPNYEEERRLFYVGLTRAKKNITISSPSKRFGKSIPKSRFLEELLEEKNKK